MQRLYSEGDSPPIPSHQIEAMPFRWLTLGLVSYRQDEYGVYRVNLPNGDMPYLLPPPDLPQGRTTLAALKAFGRRSRLTIPAELFHQPESWPNGVLEVHMWIALALMTRNGEEETGASDGEIAEFMGSRDGDDYEGGDNGR